MVRQVDPALMDRLRDDRGNRVVFLSHCLLDENVRYLGGAFHSGAVPAAADHGADREEVRVACQTVAA